MIAGKLRKYVLITFCCLSLDFMAAAQSHFLYIQSKSGTPFYVKMNDSLLSSTHAGYLILPRLQKGTYPLIVGFAKKKIPEAAFKISIDNSGDKGFLLEEANGKLVLKDIQDKKIIPPEEVATSAGNRILTSTKAIVSHDQKEEPKDIDSLLAVTDQKTETPDEPDEEAKNNKLKPQNKKGSEDNPFEKMLNAVTGGNDEPVIAKNEKSTPPSSGQEITIPNEPDQRSQDQIEDKTSVSEQEPASEGTAKKQKLSFSDLINPHKDQKPENMEPSQPENPVESAPEPQAIEPDNEELTFIHFNNDDSAGAQNSFSSPEKEDTLITTPKELRQVEKEKRREEKQKSREKRKTLFEKMIEQAPDPSQDSTSKPSIAKPLFNNPDSSNDLAEENSTAISKPEERISCASPADKEQFNKIRRKIASKKSEESMLRTAERYFSGENCYSTAQIRTLVYLFGSDEYKLRFLKAVYPYCSDKSQFGSLAQTLSSQRYQRQLNAFIK